MFIVSCEHSSCTVWVDFTTQLKYHQLETIQHRLSYDFTCDNTVMYPSTQHGWAHMVIGPIVREIRGKCLTSFVFFHTHLNLFSIQLHFDCLSSTFALSSSSSLQTQFTHAKIHTFTQHKLRSNLYFHFCFVNKNVSQLWMGHIYICNIDGHREKYQKKKINTLVC